MAPSNVCDRAAVARSRLRRPRSLPRGTHGRSAGSGLPTLCGAYGVPAVVTTELVRRITCIPCLVALDRLLPPAEVELLRRYSPAELARRGMR
jgi:hypothetical protein